MSWKMVMPKRGKPVNHALAQSLLRSLFEEPQKELQHPEWQCANCETSNFMSRQVCRKCKSAKDSKKKDHPNLQKEHPISHARTHAGKSAHSLSLSV